MNTNVQEHERNLRVSRRAASAESSPASTNIEINSILESVMVLSWPDLMKEYPSGLLHVEYRTGPDDFIEYLTVLSSGERGYWQLVCEYWTSALWSHQVGLSFSPGHSSALMTKMLEFVMDHQEAFLRRSTPTHDVLLQVNPPTEPEITAARECMREAVERIDEHTRINAAYNSRRERFERGLELLHAISNEETTAEEAATNEGMAEKPEEQTRSVA
jgi:hypothetical protein